MYSYDNNWVGAWWLGFLMAGSLSLMVAIPIAGFPKELPGKHSYVILFEGRQLQVSILCCLGSREIVSQKVLETDQRSLMSQMNFGISAKDLPKALRILLSNPPFMLLSIAGAFEGRHDEV